MLDVPLFDVPDWLSSLTKMWSRQYPLLADLQPVQLNVLIYLARCNHYSNTSFGVTDYLGLTKDTMSQSLKLLENEGLIVRKPDDRDKHGVHLHLSEPADTLLEVLLSPAFLVKGESTTGERAIAPRELLLELLCEIQRANNIPGFGLCHSCRFRQKIDGQGLCNLTRERLSEEDLLSTCREHQPPET